MLYYIGLRVGKTAGACSPVYERNRCIAIEGCGHPRLCGLGLIPCPVAVLGSRTHAHEH